jgi:hypothetical protein
MHLNLTKILIKLPFLEIPLIPKAIEWSKLLPETKEVLLGSFLIKEKPDKLAHN